ncbi:MAG: hypothetical protein ACO398_10005, partial [Kiritimatiellia bacterium]
AEQARRRHGVAGQRGIPVSHGFGLSVTDLRRGRGEGPLIKSNARSSLYGQRNQCDHALQVIFHYLFLLLTSFFT